MIDGCGKQVLGASTVAFSIFIAGMTCADEPLPPPQSIRVASPGGAFLAFADPDPPLIRIVAAAAPDALLWSVNLYSPTPHLAPDGNALLLPLHGKLLPSDEPTLPVLALVRAPGKLTRTIRLADLNPGRALQPTASHWLIYKRIVWCDMGWCVELPDGTERTVDPVAGVVAQDW